MYTSNVIDYNLSVPTHSTQDINSLWTPVVFNNNYQNSLNKFVNSILENYYIIWIEKFDLK